MNWGGFISRKAVRTVFLGEEGGRGWTAEFSRTPARRLTPSHATTSTITDLSSYNLAVASLSPVRQHLALPAGGGDAAGTRTAGGVTSWLAENPPGPRSNEHRPGERAPGQVERFAAGALTPSSQTTRQARFRGRSASSLHKRPSKASPGHVSVV